MKLYLHTWALSSWLAPYFEHDWKPSVKSNLHSSQDIFPGQNRFCNLLVLCRGLGEQSRERKERLGRVGGVTLWEGRMRRPLEEVGSPAVRVCEGRAAQCSLPRGKVGEPGVGVPLAPSGPSESCRGRGGVGGGWSGGAGPSHGTGRGGARGLGALAAFWHWSSGSGELLRAFAHGVTWSEISQRFLDGVLRVDFVVVRLETWGLLGALAVTQTRQYGHSSEEILPVVWRKSWQGFLTRQAQRVWDEEERKIDAPELSPTADFKEHPSHLWNQLQAVSGFLKPPSALVIL